MRDGDHYVVNGAKTFITNGINADLVITAVKTDPAERHRGLSLLMIERGMEGFERGRNLEKVGLHAQDTAELFFTDVRVPAANLLGEEGEGFARPGAQPRPGAAVDRRRRPSPPRAPRSAGRSTTCASASAFGQPIGTFQNDALHARRDARPRSRSPRPSSTAASARSTPASCRPSDAAMAKRWCTELQGRVVDRCVQLHGGYGYMLEYPIARAYADARVTRIYGGTNEIMKEIVGRSMGL